jgi:adenylate cyclase
LTPSMRFGPIELRPAERRLLVDGQPVVIGARAFDLLVALVQRRDRVVTKGELLDLAWPGLVVEENNLSVQISSLRRLLGAHAIATIPSLGYRFTLTETPPPAAQGITAQLGLALHSLRPGQPVRLLARWRDALDLPPAGAAADSEAAFVAAVQALVAQHGGTWLDAPGPGALQAEFASARAAAACCHLLHPLALRWRPGTPPAAGQPAQPPLCAVLAEAEPAGPGLALLQRARPGQTLATLAVTQQLVHKLDGDLRDTAAEDASDVALTPRFFDLMPPATSLPEQRPSAGGPRLKPTLAVVPFAAYARQAEAVSLGDILSDQVIGALSRSAALQVISRLSTQPFRDRAASVADIGSSLSADFVVSGRYWVAAGRLHLLVELADAATSEVLWTDALQDNELAVLQPDSALLQQLVSGVVQTVFAHGMAQLRGAALPDLASHTLLLAGINLLYRLSPRDFALARDALEAVHQRAPRHATPLAWLARWHLFRVVQGWSDDRDADGRLAMDHANRALDLDPDSSLALTMLGNVHTSYLKDLDRAEWLYDQALARNPNESLAWLQKGNARSFRGDGVNALAFARRAVRLSPLDPASHFYLTILAGAALTAQDYNQAIEAATASARLNQTHLSTHRVLAIALAMSGRLDEARASVRQVMHLRPGLTVADYIAQSPASALALTRRFADALQRAGLPAGAA